MFGDILKSEKAKIFLILFLICVLGLFLRIYKLDSRSIWVDETFSLFESTGQGQEIDALLKPEGAKKEKLTAPLLVKIYKDFLKNNKKKNLKDVAVSLLKTDTQPPLYFFLMHFWIKYFGDTLFSIRFFSVLLGILAIVCTFLFTSSLFDKKTGIFAALFIALSPFAIFYSQEARHYSLILTIALLSSYFLIKFLKTSKDIFPMIGFIIVNTFGLYTHYFYIFILLGYILYFLFSKDLQKKNKFYLSFIISLLLFSPWFLLVLKYGYNFELTEWAFGYPNSLLSVLKQICKNLPSFFITVDSPRLFNVPNYIAIVCLVFLSKILLRFRKEFSLPFIILSLPLLCMAGIDFLEKGSLLGHSRYYTFAFVGLTPIVGYTLNSNWSNRIYRIVIIFVFLTLMVNSFLVIKGFAWQSVSTPRPRNSCLWINNEHREKKIAVIIGNGRVNVMPSAFYLNEDIIIAPVSTAEQLKMAFEQLKGKVETIFMIQNFFENIIGDPLSYWLDEMGSPGFKIQEKRNFKEDYIIVYKFIYL